jgi:hypothetical protein
MRFAVSLGVGQHVFFFAGQEKNKTLTFFGFEFDRRVFLKGASERLKDQACGRFAICRGLLFH